MRIVQVSTYDIYGGAERVARDLHHAAEDLGHESFLAVGARKTSVPNFVLIPNAGASRGWAKVWWGIHDRLVRDRDRFRGVMRLSRLAADLAAPAKVAQRRKGIEDFRFPGTRMLPDSLPRLPDVLHGHNLHGGYFDLSALPELTRRFPFFLTLHDAWLLSGHCAHSFDCDRWLIGCGSCPDLTIYPAIRRDATADNFERKQDIYRRSRLFVAAPSRWLMDRAESSMLAEGMVEARVIPNGVDHGTFRPADRKGARQALGLPQDASVIVFSAAGIRTNVWKDFAAMRGAVEIAADSLPDHRIVFIGIGESAPTELFGRAEIRYVGFQSDPRVVARHIQSADVYLHAARAENGSLSIAEALSCGLPVVATAVGGIPEQVLGLAGISSHPAGGYGTDKANGVLANPGDAKGLAQGLVSLLQDDPLRGRLAENAIIDSRKRFDRRDQMRAYFEWYEEILAR